MKKIDYKWVVLLLVSLAYFLAQGTRQIYSSVLPQIKADFAARGISDTELGLVGSVFTLVFGLCIPFAGLAADLLRRKWVLITGSLVFAIGIFLSGFASGIGMLLISYGVINAIGQSLMPPCNTSFISQYHEETRGTAFSIYQTAIYLGIIVCSVASGYLASLGSGGWRRAFWIFGAIAMVWSVVMAILLKDKQPEHDKTKSGLSSVSEALKAFLAKPTSFVLMAALGFYFFATYGFKAWSPMFIIRVFPDMDPTRAVFHAVFWFYIGAFVGVTFGGRLSDKLKARFPSIRLYVELVGISLCIPFILLMAFAHSLPVMIAAILCFGFATGVYDSNLYAALFEVIDPRYRAAATGLFGCGGCIIGAFGPAVMGVLNDAFSVRVSMGSLAVFALLGAITICFATFITFKKDRI